MDNNELRHYGILGMRWGIRRSKKQLAKSNGENTHADYKKAHGQADVKNMSDQELRNRLNRLQMESQYKQMSQTKISAGKKIAAGIVVGVGTTLAKDYLTKMAKGGIDAALEKGASKNAKARSTLETLNLVKKK